MEFSNSYSRARFSRDIFILLKKNCVDINHDILSKISHLLFNSSLIKNTWCKIFTNEIKKMLN